MNFIKKKKTKKKTHFTKPKHKNNYKLKQKQNKNCAYTELCFYVIYTYIYF